MVQRAFNQAAVAVRNVEQDEVVRITGGWGTWQLRLFLCVSTVKLASGWVQLAIVFLTPPPRAFTCVSLPANTSIAVANNTCYTECLSYDIDPSPFEETLVSEWSLVCGRRWLAALAQAALQGGVLVGSLGFGVLADRYGRRPTFLAATAILVILSLLVPWSPDFWSLVALRLGCGIALAGTMVLSFVLLMEAVGPAQRETAGALFHVPFMIGQMTLPLFAYYFRRWDTYSLALAVPTLPYLLYHFVISESPRWLISVGRVDEATEILTKAATINKRPVEGISAAVSKLSAGRDLETSPPPRLLGRTLRRRTVVACVVWAACGLSFFGFNQFVAQTSPNPFLSVAAAGAIQIPSALICIWVNRRVGRRMVTVTSLSLAGLCVLVLGVLPASRTATLLLGSFGVSGGAVAAITLYLYTAELFPTRARSGGLGAATTAMRAGSLVAPWAADAGAVWAPLPTLLLGVAPLAAAAICLLLPETRGVPLDDDTGDDE